MKTKMLANQPMHGLVHWRVGKKIVTVINDGHFEAGEAFLTRIPKEGIKHILHKAFRPEQPTMTANMFLIQGDDHLPVLVDVGIGNKLAPAMTGNLLATLPDAGLMPADIGMILITHLHGDHFYGLTDNQGNKNFPNAKVWLAEAERSFWLENAGLNEADRKNAEDARAALKPYEMLVTDLPNGEIVPGITAVPLPGHTPGQTGFMLQSEGEKILFWADVLSIPAIQAPLPEIGFITDTDGLQAIETRKKILENAANERLLVAGPHLEFPCLSYVTHEGDGYRLVPRQWFA